MASATHHGLQRDYANVLNCVVDVAIVGGGIAGLWLLARLRQRGYAAVLVESERLGAGQTLCAQGIIHSGVKYTLGGTVSAAARAIAAMPERWRQCLRGAGEVDLGGARILADGHCLLISDTWGARMVGFFASQAMHDRVQRLARAQFPQPLQDARFRGAVYRLNEPVVEVKSVLAALIQAQHSALLASSTPARVEADGAILCTAPEGAVLRVAARRTVLAAGAGNAGLSPAPMQRRPLHMVMARGAALPDLYIHCLDNGATPRITLTSQRAASGDNVWYLGGRLAESGVERSPAAQIACARRELAEWLPWVDLTGVRFATFAIDRAEAASGGRRPDTPSITQTGNALTVWPTKLALAPLLADEVLQRLAADGIKPGVAAADGVARWPRPTLGEYPWERARVWT